MRKPCKIFVHAVPDGPPYYANGPMRAVAQCHTHAWPIGPVSTAPLGDMCPLGRLEKAVEDGLAEIAETLQAIAAALKGVA
jgi:hypothetical protein